MATGAYPIAVNVVTDALIYGSGTGGAMTVDSLTSGDDVTAADDVVVGDDLTIGDDVTLASGSVLTWNGDTALARSGAGALSIAGANIVTHAIADAKGDLVAGTAADALARLAVGTDGHVLKAASGQASGLQWAAATDLSTLPLGSGTAAAGSSLLAAAADHVHPATGFGPGDHGYLSWNFDPALCIGTTILGTGGTLYLARIKVPKAITVTNLVMRCTAVGATLTAGRNFAALFTAAGARVASTVDQSALWTSTGDKVMALSSAQAIAAGDYYVGLYSNGSTLPTFARGSSLSVVNTGLAAPNFRFATADTGLTTAMPNNIAAQTADSTAYWVALS